ncbi:hypothetical protein SAMN05720606_101422 [Paenibacillus polysaccharolyticus]|uniref:Uncharacterized protein n=1 Tax=Paenibacillus polysaccharolyticus TaxID=582692 RepID=A0A1G5BLB9_9BACL|nr:hypothetical protein [Paenibacillus polysaccharolyticus]SCX90948.1 hypothetical protein SAMN05720606_101422 [Paenibacillus polysaccharolyticus]
MFDPTIYDNLKVAFENYLYDLDNLDESIHITHRRDQLEMASMSREFTLRFCLRDHAAVTAEVVLKSSLQAIAAEILETPGSHPGCELELRFAWVNKEPETRCHDIQVVLQENWPDQRIVQHIHYLFGEAPVSFNVSASVYFDRQVNEEQMHDIPVLCDCMVHVLNKLKEIN